MTRMGGMRRRMSGVIGRLLGSILMGMGRMRRMSMGRHMFISSAGVPRSRLC